MSKLSVLFWRRSHTNPTKETSVYCRITIAGVREEFTTSVKASNNTWNQQKQRLKGTNDASYSANKQLDQLENNINDICYDLRRNGIPITGASILYELGGGTKKDKKYTLISMLESELSRMENEGAAKQTKNDMASTISALKIFLKDIYKEEDFYIARIDYRFIKNFENWAFSDLNGKTKWKPGTLKVKIQKIKKVVIECFNLGVISSNPFVNYKTKQVEKSFRYLTSEEVQTIENMEIDTDTIKDHIDSDNLDRCNHFKEKTVIARDIFVFCCFTGLAYVDVKNLRKENIVSDPEYGLCISTNRQKTKEAVFMPLLEKPLKILQKYENSEYHGKNGTLFPMEVNQRYNDKLRFIEKVCKIKKNITSHVGRHTAATYLLNSGIPDYIVARALGASVETIRSRYGKLLNSTVSMHFNKLNNSVKENLL